MTRLSLMACGAIVALGLGACAFIGTPKFEAALDECRISTATVADDGRTLLLDMKGEDDATGLGYPLIECVLLQIDTPVSVVAQMNETRALDGRQEATWDDIRASWSYHPDTGLDIILTQD